MPVPVVFRAASIGRETNLSAKRSRGTMNMALAWVDYPLDEKPCKGGGTLHVAESA
jgi:hypothetical protein